MKEINRTLLLGKGSWVAEHCRTVFINETFETERSSVAPGIKEDPERRKVKPHRSQ